jgi:hypothetical protein
MSYTNSGSGLPNYWPDGKFQQMAKIHKLLLEGMKLIVIERWVNLNTQVFKSSKFS